MNGSVKRRLILGGLLKLLAVGAVVAIVGDHLGWFGYRGDDRGRFDRRSVQIRDIDADGSVHVFGDSGAVTVRLIGVQATSDAIPFLRGFIGRSAVARMEPLLGRDAAGRLWAYLYLSDDDVLNVDAVREGLAKVDRSTRHSLQALMDAAETEAKKRKRGLWAATRPTTTRAAR